MNSLSLYLILTTPKPAQPDINSTYPDTKMTDSGNFVKVPNSEEEELMQKAADDSKKRREEEKKRREMEELMKKAGEDSKGRRGGDGGDSTAN